MKNLLVALVALIVILVSGCASTVGEVHGDIQAPPSTASTSGATEDLIAQKADATARSGISAANLKAALAEQKAAQAELWRAKSVDETAAAKADLAKATADVAAARADANKAKADKQALTGALNDQRAAEASGTLTRYYGLAVLLLALAAFLYYEGSTKIAAGIAVVAGALVFGAVAVSFVLAHQNAVLAFAVIIGVVALIWHYRKKEAKLWAAIMHLRSGSSFTWAGHEVKDVLVSAWLKARGWAETALHRAEALLHLTGHSSMAAPTMATGTAGTDTLPPAQTATKPDTPRAGPSLGAIPTHSTTP